MKITCYSYGIYLFFEITENVVKNLEIASYLTNLFVYFNPCLRALNGKLTVQEEQITEYIDKISVMEEEVKRVSDVFQLCLKSAKKWKKFIAPFKRQKKLWGKNSQKILFIVVLKVPQLAS